MYPSPKFGCSTSGYIEEFADKQKKKHFWVFLLNFPSKILSGHCTLHYHGQWILGVQHCEYKQKKRPSTVLFTLLTWRIGSLVLRNCGLFTQKLSVTAGWYISYSFCTEGWFDAKVDVSTSSKQQFKNSSHTKTVQSCKEDRIRRKIS